MSSLILNLDGPLQSWGSSSRFNTRGTDDRPTKSGVIGLVAAALGRYRDADISDLATLRMGVRVDTPGSRMRDFQTEIDWRTNKPKPLTHRYYLQDAKFVVVLEGEKALIENIGQAIRQPAFPLYLGRRACPPARPIFGGIFEEPLDRVLRQADWLATPNDRRRREKKVYLSYTRDQAAGEEADEIIRDVPVSFNPAHRAYSLRGVVHGMVEIENETSDDRDNTNNYHDPMVLLGGE